MAEAKERVFIKLDDVRLSFPKLWTPKSFSKNQKPRFEASFLLDPSRKEHAAAMAKIKKEKDRVIAEKWNGKIPPKLKLSFGLADDNEMAYDGYEGMFYIATAAQAKNRPKLLDRNRNPTTEEDGLLYGGCFVNALVSLWAWEFKNEEGGTTRGVNTNLHIVQYNRKGDAFGVKPPDEEEHFDALGDEEGSDSSGDDGASTGWDE